MNPYAAGWIAAAALTAGACGARSVVIDAALPEGADRVAVLAESSDGSLLWATPVRPADEDPLRLEVEEAPPEGALLTLVAWAASDLAQLSVDDSPLRRARPSEAQLPAPRFAVRGPLVEGRVAPAPVLPEDLSPLTAGAVSSCPARVPPGAIVDSSCAAATCFVGLEQTGCALDVDLAGCGLGGLHGLIDSAGVPHVDGTPEIGPCEEEVAGDTALSLRCARPSGDTCRVDAIAPDLAVRAFGGAVTRAQVVTVTSTRPFQRGSAIPGYLGGLVALDDRLLVAAYEERTQVWCARADAHVAVVDAATLAVRTGTTALRCLTALTVDPAFGGALGAYRDGAGWALARLDRDGRMVERLPVDTEGLAVTRLTSLPSGLVFAALSRESGGGAGVVALSALTGQERWRAREGGKKYLDLKAFDDEVVALDEGSGFAYAFRAADGQLRLAAPFGLACGVQGADPLRLWPFRDPDRWVTTAIGDGAEILVLTPERSTGCDNASAFAAPRAEPLALAPAPGGDPERLVVGLWTTDGDAVLARLDAARTRFLPGLVRLGRGHVGELATVGDAVFATLPQSGEVVRLAP